jgi:hypothetical protein
MATNSIYLGVVIFVIVLLILAIWWWWPTSDVSSGVASQYTLLAPTSAGAIVTDIAITVKHIDDLFIQLIASHDLPTEAHQMAKSFGVELGLVSQMIANLPQTQQTYVMFYKGISKFTLLIPLLVDRIKSASQEMLIDSQADSTIATEIVQQLRKLEQLINALGVVLGIAPTLPPGYFVPPQQAAQMQGMTIQQQQIYLAQLMQTSQQQMPQQQMPPPDPRLSHMFG